MGIVFIDFKKALNPFPIISCYRQITNVQEFPKSTDMDSELNRNIKVSTTNADSIV